MKRKTAYEGLVLPRIFRHYGSYRNSRMKPLRPILRTPLLDLYWVVYPKRDEWGWKLKDDVLELVGSMHDVMIELHTRGKYEIAKKIKYSPRYREELAKHNPKKYTAMFSVYSKIDGGYIGTVDDAYFYHQRGIEQLQKIADDHNTCCIGFNKSENKWYGWSHRAMFGFTIGSEVKKGDCAYNPNTKEAMAEDMKRFWYDHEERHSDWKCEMDTKDPTNGRKGIGISYSYVSVAKDGSSIKHSGFEPYPEKWGRGEWKATTMEEAKEMAIDFANGVD